jgi:casein kinase 1
MALVADRFQLLELTGSGAFGLVYKAYDTEEKKIVALKLEPIDTSMYMLAREQMVYKALDGQEGFPNQYGLYYDCRVHHRDYTCLAMDFLGPSLEDLVKRCNGKFTMKTVCQIAVQAIDRIHSLHSKNLLHRDIKPDNFLFRDGTLYMIDFGMAKHYRDPTTHCHIEYKDHKSLVGTPRYASINAHLGIQCSRRDDLESLGYMLMYLLRGSLPWQGIRAQSKRRKYQKIMEKKLATPIDLLCRGYPRNFEAYFEYVRALRFADKPDYDYLKRLFVEVGPQLGFELDNKWDWDTLLGAIPEEGDEKKEGSSLEAVEEKET